ncbi:MAG: hypothetical protein V3S83_04950 [Gemmatimonadota bacterium]
MGRVIFWIAAASAIAFPASTAWGQAAPKASYVADLSFELPAKGQPGGPDRPTALAVGPDGNVHIADERGLIFVYDSYGVYQRSYGRGRLSRPARLAIHPSGEAYVLDTSRNQVVVFAPGGEVLRMISSKGSKGGQLSKPIDFALGPNGYIYVLDNGRNGIQIFSRDGVYIRDVVPPEVVRKPAAVSVGNDGAIYITDKENSNQVYRFDPFTQLPWFTAMPRGLEARIPVRGARFEDPAAMAVNDLGTILILDKKFGRVWRANPSGGEFGPNDLLYGGIGTGRGSFREAVDIAFAGPDQVLILDKQLRKVERIQLTTERDLNKRERFDFPLRVSRGARSLPSPLLAIGYGPDGSPRLAFSENKGTVKIVGTQTEYHLTAYGDSVPSYLPNPAAMMRQFSGDIGEAAAVVLNDTLAIIADSRRNRFTIYDLQTGAGRGTYGDNYRDNRRLRSPHGVALLPDGRVVIADTGNDRIKIFSSDLASLVASYPVKEPQGISIGPSGEIVTWNEKGDFVGLLSPEGNRFEPLSSTLLPGPISALTFDAAGNLLMLERATQRVTVIEEGLRRILIRFGSEGTLNRPTRITVDRSGNIYITDDGAKRTAVYRWDVESPKLAGVSVDYEEDAAEITWIAPETDYISHYEIQAADDIAGPYSSIGTTLRPPFRINVADSGGSPPHYVRVAPIFITGVAGTPAPPLPLFNFTVAAAYRRGDYREAQEDAQQAIELIDSGMLEADDDALADILYYAFASAYAERNYPGAMDWGGLLLPVMTREHVVDFLFKLAEVHLQGGDAQGASQRILTLVGQGPRPEYFLNTSVVGQSFRIYRALRNSGYAADALEFLRLYAQAMPATIPELQVSYRDSITVFATRTKLAPGFEYWRSAAFDDAVGFFENVLLTAGLSTEQQVLSRQVLAAAYYAYGRRSEAEDTFREIYTVRPSFDLNREIPRVRILYGLTIYNPETQGFFGRLGSRS